MEKKLIPAPIDEKNVTTDWIAEIFDNCGDCVRSNKKFVGFVNDSVCFCEYSNYHLLWYMPVSLARNLKDSWDELIRRLKEHDTPPLIVSYYINEGEQYYELRQDFFWKDE